MESRVSLAVEAAHGKPPSKWRSEARWFPVWVQLQFKEDLEKENGPIWIVTTEELGLTFRTC